MDKVTVKTFQEMKDNGKKITMISAYSYPFARIADEIGIDSLLIGDSLGMTVLGELNELTS